MNDQPATLSSMRTRPIVETLLIVSLCCVSFVFVQHFLTAHDLSSLAHLGTLQDADYHIPHQLTVASSGAEHHGTNLPELPTEHGIHMVPPSFNDKTLIWSSRSQTPNLTTGEGLENGGHQHSQTPPPYQLLLTDFRWNNPDQRHGLNYSRVLRTRELLQGVVNHPNFNANGWEELTSGRRPIDPDIRYYVFLDVETCYEANYPHYGAPYKENFDRVGGRVVAENHLPLDCYFVQNCPFVDQVLQSPLFRHPHVTSRLIYFDCLGLSIHARFRNVQQRSPKLALASVSAEPSQHLSSVDQGLPPPAVTKFALSSQQERDIATCSETDRQYFFTFVGMVRVQHAARVDLVRLHDPSEGVVVLPRRDFPTHYPNRSYSDMLQQSIFAATPRGDNRFSYRFTEVLASGAIPVIHSDGWVLPFRSELVDWTDCAVRIPEAHVNATIAMLRQIPLNVRCRMRRRCYDIYQQYMATTQGTIAGIVEGLELVAGAGAE